MTTEAKVGAFVLGCFAILAFTVVYLLHAQFGSNTDPFLTYLRYAGGLQPGAQVLFGGINVGEVKGVRPWASDPTRIEILFEVTNGTPLNEKSIAKLGFVSIMNSAALSISTGSNDAKRLPPNSTVPSQEAASLDEIAGKMATVAESADALIKQAQGELEGITHDARGVLANLNNMTGGPNQRRVQMILSRIDGLLASEGPKIDRLTVQLMAVSQHADGAIKNVDGTVTELREPIRKDLTELQQTLQEAHVLLENMQAIVRSNNYKIDDTVENLRVATDNLGQLTDSLKQRPWSLIRIKPPMDRKVPQ
jgi:phospholipid/cholesterol/gamma-HCH transport system substrate-binding protein